MSPRFTPNPKAATSGFITYPKDTYVVELGEPKAFFKQGSNGKGDNYGVRFAGKIREAASNTQLIGKPFPLTLYLHTEGAENYSKGIQMAALGDRKDEEFNEKHGDLDWSFNTDDGSCGGGWHEMKGQAIKIEVGDVKMNEKQEEQTGDMRFSPAN
jgi:hypothetical protein